MGKRAAVLLFVLTYLIVLCATAPAALLDAALRRASGDRLALANADGTVWNGSALLSLRLQEGRLQPLQPLHWRIFATSLLTGKIRAQLSGDDAAPATEATLSLGGLELRHAQFQLPALVLDETSPILRPARFRGRLDIHADRLSVSPGGLDGSVTIDWRQASSALSRIAPLGNYRLTLDGAGTSIRVGLATVSGMLLLDGQGSWRAGRGLEFHGNARAAAGNEDSLTELLHHLGPETAPGVHSFNLMPQ